MPEPNTTEPTVSPRARLATVLRDEARASLDAALKAEGITLTDEARDRIVGVIVASVDKLPDRTVHWLTGGDEATLRAACRDMAGRKLAKALDELSPLSPMGALLTVLRARFGGRR